MGLERARAGTVLDGGTGASGECPRPVAPAPVVVGSAAGSSVGGTAADPPPVAAGWAPWAVPQLERAVEIVRGAPAGASAAATLYREWFAPAVAEVPVRWPRRPLAGLYRSAHAGAPRRRPDGHWVLARHDVVGADGWWRTWGEQWTPPRSRRESVRLVLTPHAGRLAGFVATLTAAMLGVEVPWSLSCAVDPARARRVGSAVLDVPSLDALPAGLLERLAPTLRPVTPPLCEPVAPGAGLAVPPPNGAGFGEHRCHLVATALRHPTSEADPLRAIAAVFTAHGIDPATPHRPRRLPSPTRDLSGPHRR